MKIYISVWVDIIASAELEFARGEHDEVKRSKAKHPLTPRQNNQEISRVGRERRNTEGR